MKTPNKGWIVFSALITLTILPQTARAVIPPDLIFSVGSQIIQFFSLAALFLSAIAATCFQFFKTQYYNLKHKKILVAIIAVIIVGLSLAGAYLYANYQQQIEYTAWIQESETQEQRYQEQTNSIPEKGDQTSTLTKPTSQQIDLEDQNNQFAPGPETTATKDEPFLSYADLSSPETQFINQYYQLIATGKLDDAYELSKKSANRETFKSWYQDLTQIIVKSIIPLDNQTYSIDLTLKENNAYTEYKTIMTLTLANNLPKAVASSSVTVLSSGSISNYPEKGETPTAPTITSTTSSSTQRSAIYVTNQEFEKILNTPKQKYVILDARETIEYQNGNLPGSTHIRFSDLKDGQWQNLPADQPIYVLCWSGIRGQEVTEFLRSKNLNALYFEDGANGWVTYGGIWNGNIRFAQKYTKAQYTKTFTTTNVRDQVQTGTILVDSREPAKFAAAGLPGSFNIPLMHTPTAQLETVFGQLPPSSKIITICDGYVNCFDAKLTGVELENRGHTFLGRYTKPWEYAN